ncbi:Uncharacterized protein FKW44_011354 [Caligus rogercresseyi]|uniref:DDE-1 domain-containing protein n=1 Tax=Caligus rogercresseyi TaxID=217165 RepID=A0A7T8K9N0_CALRO|nr:Uncharacterized protein FKW44_011354 [Caligus rogercresseyi]
MCGRTLVGPVPEVLHCQHGSFLPEGQWLFSSPDLNPSDFAVWGELERKTNRTPHPNVDALKTTIRTEWDNMSEEFLINSCKTFRHRVEAIVEAERGYIE